MNILYVIYSGIGTGSGGHFHSLDQISRKTSAIYNVKILTIGRKFSPVLLENPNFYKHVISSIGISGAAKLNREIKSLNKTFKPDIIHCFDTESLNRIILLPSTYNSHIVLNKCGGPNPHRRNYQHANGIVLFSHENYRWFIDNKKYNSDSIHLIANRVEELAFPSDFDSEGLANDGKITFLRVSRLGGAYEKTLYDTFNMIEELKDEYKVELLVVGKIQNENRYFECQRSALQRNLPVSFITDSRASKGSNFIFFADIVIGTGRSFMEGLSLGLPCLTPAKNTTWPVLVNENNFENFFQTNFSERNIADDTTIKSNRENIIKLISDKKFYISAKKTAKTLFQKHLDTKMIQTKYSNLYEQVLSNSKRKPILILQNSPYIFQLFFKNSIAKLKSNS